MQLLRRSLAGDFLWATTLFRRYPSILVLAGAIIIGTWLLWPLLETLPQMWAVQTGVVAFIAVNATITRTYTVRTTVEALRDVDDTVRDRIQTSLRHLPAVCLTLLGTVFAAVIVIGALSLLIWVVGSVLSPSAGSTHPTFAVEAAFEGSAASVVFGSVSALTVYKFWLAPEICVAGGYGPVTAMRLSWTATRLHRFRTLFVVTGFASTMVIPDVGRRTIIAVGGDWLLWDPFIGLLQLVFFGLGYVVWYAVGTQIYLRAALSNDLLADSNDTQNAF